MKAFRLVSMLVLVAGVSACGASSVSRNMPFETLPRNAEAAVPHGYRQASLPQAAMALRATEARPMHIVDYTIKVPQDLTVSEANLYHPMSDIVWREDPIGNRKEQIGKIFQTSLDSARAQLPDGQGVTVELTVRRFHALTQKARYTVGGLHTVNFDMVVRDARSGAVIRETPVHLNFAAYGGRKAMAAERQGITQKVRIIDHLTRAIQAELTLPGGWNDMDTKLDNALSQI